MVVAISPELDRSYGRLNPFSILSRMDRRPPLGVRLPLVEPTAQKVLARVQQEPIEKSLSSKTVSTLTVTDLSASFARNVLRLAPAFGPTHPLVQGLGYTSSGIGLLLGSTVTIGSNVADLNKAQKIGDGEGMRRAASQIATGVVSINAVTLSLLHDIALSSLSALGIAANVFFGLGSLLTLMLSGWTIYRSACFYFKIDTDMDKQSLNEKERVVQTLKFIKEKITPTESEKAAVIKEVEKLHPNWTVQEKHAAVNQKMIDLIEVKMRYIQRRSSSAISQRLLKEVDQHLEQLKNPLADAKSLAAAKELIEALKTENKKKILFTALVAVASLISFTALVLSIFFSLGTLSLVLYTASSAIALGILLCPLVVEKLAQTRAAAMQNRARSISPLVISANPH